jgi:hypothetical protein
MKSMASVNKPIPMKKDQSEQFLYLGRWVDKKGFRAFVYDKDGNETLANSYPEFEKLTSSGIWFASREDASPKRKLKHDAAIPNSK